MAHPMSRSLDDDMIMVLHQAEGMHPPVRFLASLRKGLDEFMPIHVVQEDIIALVPTAHHVIQGTGILHSHLARHGPRVGPAALRSQPQTAELSTV
jgi:hypothetical protein